MRLLICGDLHYRGSNPRARTDDFQKALDEKIDEVFSLARVHKVNGIVIPGDIFDSPAPSYSVFGDLVKRFREGYLLYRFDPDCQGGLHVLTVPGNHDLFGHNEASKHRTAYGALWDAEMVHDLTSEAAEFYSSRVLVEGQSYTTDTDNGPCDDTYILRPGVRERCRKHFDTFVLVAHGMALPAAPGFEMRHTLLSDIAAHPDAPDILICGHEHCGFGAKWYPRGDGTEMLAINPGALCRLSANPAEIERQVQVCLLDIHGRDPATNLLKVDVEMIPLQSAKPGHEVLSREHLVAAAEREERINKFLDLLASEGEVKFLETRQIVEELGKREGLPAEIVEEALRRIGKASEELGRAEEAR